MSLSSSLSETNCIPTIDSNDSNGFSIKRRIYKKDNCGAHTGVALFNFICLKCGAHTGAALIQGPLSYGGRSHTGDALIRGPLSYGGCAHTGAALIRGPLSYGGRSHSGTALIRGPLSYGGCSHSSKYGRVEVEHFIVS